MTDQTILFQRRCANDLVDAAQTRMRALSLSQQQTVIDFIEFLASKQVVESGKAEDKSSPVLIERDESSDRESFTQQRIPDLDKSKYWMSDDFDAPLPDEFWLGED